ncbi:hypothetical protein FACS189454_05360 [Planctomycetales bacterium]|nr:hypothetical protein FACS189454_05360 [Planctomycetales bacterium]
MFVSAGTFAIVAEPSDPFQDFEKFFVQPKHYVAAKTSTPPVIDGDISEKVWQLAEWTEEFRDIEGASKPLPYYATKAKMLWDQDYLYIAAELKDKHVWALLGQRDQIVYHDNDFEVFIDPSNRAHNYFEFEINAKNTMFDLFLIKPYRSGKGALISWDCKGVKHAVKINGSLNDTSDEDTGWMVEMAIPFKGLESQPPRDKDYWRVGFSRVEWDTHIVDGRYEKNVDNKGKRLPERNWVWSPTGAIDMHMPERWGYVQFSAQEIGTELPKFEFPYREKQRQYLWLIFYKQRQYRSQHQQFAKTLQELGVDSTVEIDGSANSLTLESTTSQFTVTIKDSTRPPIRLNDEGLVRE